MLKTNQLFIRGQSPAALKCRGTVPKKLLEPSQASPEVGPEDKGDDGEWDDSDEPGAIEQVPALSICKPFPQQDA